MISTPFPWSIITLLISKPTICKVTTSALLWGWIVPSLSTSENPKTGCSYSLIFLSGLPSSSTFDCGDIVITPLIESGSFLGAAKMTLIVPREDRGTVLLWDPNTGCSPWVASWCKNCFNFPTLTNYVRTYVIQLLGKYVTILCNWLIIWKNTLYLYLGRSRMCLILQETVLQDQVLKTCKSIQETSWRSACH